MTRKEGRLAEKEEEEEEGEEGWQRVQQHRESNFSEWREGREWEAAPDFPSGNPSLFKRPELS